MPVMLKCYSVIIDSSISERGKGKELVDGINAIDKCYIYKLMSNFKLPGSKLFDSHILIHYFTQDNDVSMAK